MSHLDGSVQVLTKPLCRFSSIVSLIVYKHLCPYIPFMFYLTSFTPLAHFYMSMCVEELVQDGLHDPPLLVSAPLQDPFPVVMGGTCDLSLTGYGKGDGMPCVFHNHIRFCLAVDLLWSVLVLVALISQ